MFLAVLFLYVIFCAIAGFVGGWKTYLTFLIVPAALVAGIVLYQLYVVAPGLEDGAGAGTGLGILMAFAMVLLGAGLIAFLAFLGIGYIVRKNSYSDGVR